VPLNRLFRTHTLSLPINLLSIFLSFLFLQTTKTFFFLLGIGFNISLRDQIFIS
jgi:hypothetical protein